MDSSITDLQSARACRNYAGIFPDMAADLNRLEATFLRHVVSDQLNQNRSRPLDLRRAKVAAWPDLLADLENAAKRKSGGLSIDEESLKQRIHDISVEMDAHDFLQDEDQIPQMRKVAGVTTPVAHESSYFPDWVNHFGRRNPNLLSERRQKRLQAQVQAHPTLKKYQLKEIYLLDFIGRNIGAHGAMGEFAREAWAYHRSPWYWHVSTDLSEDLIKTISKAINDISPAAHQIAAVLWHHPHAWHYASTTDVAAEATVEAIASVYDAIRFAPADHITSADQIPEIQGMKEAVLRLKSARTALADELAKLYPNESLGGIAENAVKGDMVGNIIWGIRSCEIKLSAPRSFWQKIERAIILWRSPHKGHCHYLINAFDWHQNPKQLRPRLSN